MPARHFPVLRAARPQQWLPCLLYVALVGCQTAPPMASAQSSSPPHPVVAGPDTVQQVQEISDSARALRPRDLATIDAMVPILAQRRVVFVGETHNRYADHLVQLEIIRRLRALHPDLAIGMEYFQQPFQQYLDEYVAGRLDEASMLRKTQYFERWRFDYRLYRPILEYARQHRLPLVALNVPAEVTDKVAREGMAALSPEDRKYVPREMDRSDAGYVKRLEAVFRHHPQTPSREFSRFLDVQLLWDEGMAERAAEFLRTHPKTGLVVLAGAGHIAYGDGIPRRLVRRIHVKTATVLNGLENGVGPDVADFLVLSPEVQLPPAGRLGVAMEARGSAVIVARLEPGSAAAVAGLRSGDALMAIDGQPVHTVADVKIALLGKRPGSRVSLVVRRQGWLGEREKTYAVTLGS
jgi:uncharacterized iron-regulated protein